MRESSGDFSRSGQRLIAARLLNLITVKWYGESEFWLSMGKVILIVGLILYTFITMLGGNPEHDRFGFR